MLAEKINLDFFAGQIELGIRHHMGGRQRHYFGAFAFDVQRFDQRWGRSR